MPDTTPPLPEIPPIRLRLPPRVGQLLAEPAIRHAGLLALHHLGQIRLADFFQPAEKEPAAPENE